MMSEEMQLRALHWFFVWLFIPLIANSSPAIDFIYPAPESGGDVRTQFPVKLLKLALSKSCQPCGVRSSGVVMQKNRAFLELEKRHGLVNIVWSTTSEERERAYLPIRIPIYKGLIGWRIPLVTPATEVKLAALRSIDDLRNYTFGQGLGWPDSDILRANGMKVVEAVQYDSLFQMLARGRFDLFPRSIIEIGPEAERFASAGIMIDRHITIHYRDAFYFFVNKENQELAEIVRQGLEQAQYDGSFDRLLWQSFGDVIKQAHFERRKVVELANPLLPMQTPLDKKELWIDIPQLMLKKGFKTRPVEAH